MAWTIKPANECRFDQLSLGEVMVRLSPPGHGRIEFANTMEVWVGGGEYNVAYALARFGLRAAWVGGLVDNPVAGIVRQHARAGGVDIGHAVTLPYDGVGRAARMGLNFTEVGVGPRASVTLYDRGHSATSLIKPGDVDWAAVFAEGVRWFHTGGIYAALSDASRATVAVAVEAAKASGAVCSYDLNFRSKLWSAKQAQASTKPLLKHLDVLIGNEEDFQKSLGYEVEGTDERLAQLPVESYRRMVRRVAADHPNLTAIGTTLRTVGSASENGWTALLYWVPTDTFLFGPTFDRLAIADRVGGGDGFASGLIYGLLTGRDTQDAVNLGTAHGALAQSTRGDTTQVTLAELEHVAAGGGARIVR